jgi:hypothetical protein
MQLRLFSRYLSHTFYRVLIGLCIGAFSILGTCEVTQAPAPLLKVGEPVDWWFVFKFNAKSFPACGSTPKRTCPFGGKPQAYSQFGQQYAYASSQDANLKKGGGCTGETETDPVGATFQQIYEGGYFYVIWNDQFYDHPKIQGCTKACGSPWGHSKGILAWDGSGEGIVMQVSTPSWPASGSKDFPRKGDGNTLGCVIDNNVKVSQHFFSMRLNKSDVLMILDALLNASVVTDPDDQELVNSGGPKDIMQRVSALGKRSESTTVTLGHLSNGIQVISKPSKLHVPPWQLVSSLLDGTALRTATWWASPRIYTSTGASKIGCWSPNLHKPARVEIATTGQFDGKELGLQGGSGPNFNHAKIGVSISGPQYLAIFGDMNQQGTLSGNCESSQNGRGGLFYVASDKTLHQSLSALIDGDTAPTKAPIPQ